MVSRFLHAYSEAFGLASYLLRLRDFVADKECIVSLVAKSSTCSHVTILSSSPVDNSIRICATHAVPTHHYTQSTAIKRRA
jgi:hypothetical protein